MYLSKTNEWESMEWNGMYLSKKEWKRMEWNQVTLIECFKIREWKWMKINGM